MEDWLEVDGGVAWVSGLPKGARGEEILDPSFPFSPETPDTQANGGGSAGKRYHNFRHYEHKLLLLSEKKHFLKQKFNFGSKDQRYSRRIGS